MPAFLPRQSGDGPANNTKIRLTNSHCHGGEISKAVQQSTTMHSKAQNSLTISNPTWRNSPGIPTAHTLPYESESHASCCEPLARARHARPNLWHVPGMRPTTCTLCVRPRRTVCLWYCTVRCVHLPHVSDGENETCSESTVECSAVQISHVYTSKCKHAQNQL